MKKDGTFYAEPPTYPPIKSCDKSMNLHEFISMKKNNEYGIVSKEFYKL